MVSGIESKKGALIFAQKTEPPLNSVEGYKFYQSHNKKAAIFNNFLKNSDIIIIYNMNYMLLPTVSPIYLLESPIRKGVE